MSEQNIWHSVAMVIYLLTLNYLRKGFANSSSWFCLFFAMYFTGNVFGYLFASLNDPFFRWMKGLSATTLHGQILVTAMMVSWIVHLLVRRHIASVRLFKRLPTLVVQDAKLDQVFRKSAFVGAALAMVLSLSGYLGYFIRPEYLENPPSWLEVAKGIIAACNGALFLVVAREFRSSGKTSKSTNFLLIVWVVAGLFAGFKTMVVSPALILMVGAWLSQKLMARHFAVFGFLVVLAYSVVEPLREAKIRSRTLTARQGMMEVLGSDEFAMMSVTQVIESFSRRIDFTTTGVQTLQAYERNGLKETERRLREYFRLFPIMAAVPRGMWPDKPLANIGAVLCVELSGISRNSVTPSTPVMTFVWHGWPSVFLVYSVWAVLCTVGGQIVANTKMQFYQYSPFILFAVILSQTSEIMASTYIIILRLSGVLVLLYWFGLMSKSRSVNR